MLTDIDLHGFENTVLFIFGMAMELTIISSLLSFCPVEKSRYHPLTYGDKKVPSLIAPRGPFRQLRVVTTSMQSL